MAKVKTGRWAPGTMRDGILKLRKARESKAAGRDVFAYKVPYRDASGRQTSETWASLKDAERFRDLVRSQRHAGLLEDFGAGARLVKDWAAEWLASTREQRRESTYRAYEGLVRLYVVPALGAMAVRSVTQLDVQRAVNSWAARRSARTVALAYKVLGQVFKAAVTNGLRRSSPCVDIVLPEVEEGERMPFTLAEVSALAEAIGPRYAMLVRFAAETGLRLGEIRGLTRDNVDVDAGVVRVVRQLRGGVFHPVKSRESKRVVPLRAAFAAELATYLAANPVAAREVPVKGGDPVTVEPLFTAPRGGLLGDESLRGPWGRACAAVGIPEGRREFHRLRHTFASHLIAAGAPTLMITKAMGHSSILITTQVYGHLMPTAADDLRAALERAYGAAEGAKDVVADNEDTGAE